ncbi:ABC transporter ATP-binding protein [Robbsia sp. Bb-Pol-6]|uniref:ABC transporter ATP-binding protein n=1 Tax=Robbsia betulipollinis TaxID=2981849 RepID=A0ABT3ZH93_9BURK|nr:ABC transporter ATP-binding protein [Robbsia betulipollinis]MCY0385727.1 ABC transporter ATP-binding protein [Robbsia betulipollinis]
MSTTPSTARARAQTAPILEIDGLDIRLPPGADRALAVRGVSLCLRAGETLCIVGESGSGKSMIANAVMGLLPTPRVAPVAGRILFEGVDLLALDEARMRTLRGRRIGMIFQEPMTALNPLMRIGEQIGEVFDAHASGFGADEKRRRIVAALADVGLPEPERLIDSYPFRLSGGQRQRVMIACALLLEPRLLIADEPTTALDVTTQAQILALLRDLQTRRGTAVLFITHDFGVVSAIADQVVVMQAGEVVEAGAARRVLTHPEHAYTRRLIASIPDGVVAERAPGTDPHYVLQVQDLCKTYRTGSGLLSGKARVVHAARDVTFALRRGETLGIVGESGSGKSSVGRCLVGLSDFDSGRILFNGRNLSRGAQSRRLARGKIQMVFQDPYASLNPRQRVGEAVASGPIAQGMPRAQALTQAAELLHLVGLDADAAARFPHEFSGGQRQRIGIARALATEPELLVADEPVSALDVSVQAQVLALFAEVRERFQLAMVFITHDLRVAAGMCDHIAVMQRGTIVEYGRTAQVLAAPRHAYTRKLIAAIPRLLRDPAMDAAADAAADAAPDAADFTGA